MPLQSGSPQRPWLPAMPAVGEAATGRAHLSDEARLGLLAFIAHHHEVTQDLLKLIRGNLIEQALDGLLLLLLLGVVSTQLAHLQQQ